MISVKKKIEYEPGICCGDRFGVAVLDSGVQSYHPDLEGKIRYFKDYVRDLELPYDDNGHGTHICGIIGGSGLASAGKYSGLCSNVNFIVLKVLDKNGAGDSKTLYEACKWVLGNYKEYKIRIINISIGGKENKNLIYQEKTKWILDELWKRGVCVICAAGNAGPGENTVSYLGRGEYRICVGCHEGPGTGSWLNGCFRYSGRGSKGERNKPDILAPGTKIVSCNAFFDRGNHKFYVAKSGTSMATAVVTGVVADMICRRRDLSINQLKEIVLKSAIDVKEPTWAQGSGFLNCKKILTQMV